ncbi:sigma factor-like helix-turn-helix DNA-binding protein [Actinomadura nitritigenes]|uniref:sigma factor-like helix-turn-helix DNA-binding protein n=1 Tax=Actinomadura nitritigenes TaxID=134602 RepID=UPI003D94FFA1
MAMLLVLETLQPTERAVFVLREVFDLDYDEIAEAVGKSPAAVRQLAYRARSHVAARRPRGTAPRPRREPPFRRSSGPSRPASSRACSTSSRPTSSP